MAEPELSADDEAAIRAILLRALEEWFKKLERELDKVFYPYGDEW